MHVGVDKPKLYRVILGALGAVGVALGEHFVSFNYDSLLNGDKWEFRRFLGVTLSVVGAALWAYITKRPGDVPAERVAEIRERYDMLLSEIRPKADPSNDVQPEGE